MILFEGDREVEVNEALAADLLIKWGYEVKDRVEVRKLEDMILEIAMWGIPCKRIKWNF